jgi:hypothetical protein
MRPFELILGMSLFLVAAGGPALARQDKDDKGDKGGGKKDKGPAAGSVKIEGITYDGDGCPPGSLSLALSDDAQALTIR